MAGGRISMMRIPDINLPILGTTITFLRKHFGAIGARMMQSDTNASQTPTTNSSEKTTSARSYHLRHIFDDQTFPQLSLRVCLSGPPEDRYGYAQWLGRAGCRFVDDPLEADFVIFTGGADVSPTLYNDVPIWQTHADPARDQEDLALYQLCQGNRIPMVGICRGSQFLWTRMGGKLFQDVDNHNDGEHEIYVFGENKRYRASSVHHQMARPEAIPGFKLLANSCVSKKREAGNWVNTGPSSDFEIWTFPEKAILGIQGHPEYPGYPAYSELCVRMIDKYIYDNPSTIYSKGKLRLKPELAVVADALKQENN